MRSGSRGWVHSPPAHGGAKANGHRNLPGGGSQTRRIERWRWVNLKDGVGSSNVGRYAVRGTEYTNPASSYRAPRAQRACLPEAVRPECRSAKISIRGPGLWVLRFCVLSTSGNYSVPFPSCGGFKLTQRPSGRVKDGRETIATRRPARRGVAPHLS